MGQYAWGDGLRVQNKPAWVPKNSLLVKSYNKGDIVNTNGVSLEITPTVP